MQKNICEFPIRIFGGSKMDKKILGIVICMLLLATAVFPAMAEEDERGGDTAAGSTLTRAWTIVATYPIPEGASGLAWDGTYLYCGIYGANGDEIYRIDPATGSYTLLCHGPQDDAYGLTYDGTYLWTTHHPGSQSEPAKALQIDMEGNLISQFDLPDHFMSGIAYDGGDFWVATYYPDNPATIYKVNATGTIITQFDAPDNQPWDLCMENGYLWMVDKWGDRDNIYKIDPATGNSLESYSSEGSDPTGIVYDGEFLWYCDEGQGGYDYLYKVNLSGPGTPAIEIPDTSHDYGVVTVGNSETWYVTVQNVGTADLIINNITFTGIGSGDVYCSISLPVTIGPGNSTLLPIVYEPTATGPLSATATVASNDPVDPTVELTLTGNATNPGPDITLPENSHDYGNVRMYAYPHWLMEIQNTGDATLTVSNITSSDSHFIIGDSVTFPLNIPVLSSVQIDVWFWPDDDILYSATLSIESNDPDESVYNVSVTGTGVDADYPIGTTLWDYQVTGGYDNSPKAISAIPDINGDTVPDVIVCSEDNYIRCLNGNSDVNADMLWEHEIYAGAVYSQNDLAITDDIDGDGYNDVVVGSCWGGRLIRTISGKTGQEIWTHDTHEYGEGGWVYQVDCSYDYNGDGILDVLAATGDDQYNTGPKRVYCLNGLDGTSIWETPIGGVVYSVIGVEDFTGDGQPDVVAGPSNELETIGYVYGLNGSNGNTVWSFTVAGSSVWALMQVDDITGDGVPDVVAGDFSGWIYGLDATNGAEEWNETIGPSMILRFEKLNDVNDDGYPDILVAHSGTSAKVVDGYRGDTIWSHGLVDKSWCVARSSDISGDGIDDVFVGTLYSNNYCYFLNGTDGSELYSVDFGTPVDALASIPDIVGDGSMEMVVGGRNGYVACLSGGLDALTTQPFDFSFYSGWNLLTIPFENNYTASDVAALVPGCEMLAWWNAATSSYTTFIVGVTPPGSPWDFAIAGGVGYYVKVAGDVNVTLHGIPLTSASVTLYPGWNTIGWWKETPTNASSLSSHISTCTMLAMYDAETGTYTTFIVGITPPGSPYDFTVEQGMGLFAKVTSGSIWNGEG